MTWALKNLIHLLFLLTLAATMAASQAAPRPLVVVALGTSFTAGQGVSKQEAYPAQLETMLRAAGEEVEVRNAGVPGDSTREIRSRVGQAVPGYTDLVILEYSTMNDTRAGIAPAATVANCEDIISNITSRGIPVLLVIRGRDKADLQERAASLLEVIAKHQIAWVTIAQPASSLWDGVHPNAAAHQEIATGLVAPVTRMLDLIKARKNQQ